LLIAESLRNSIFPFLHPIKKLLHSDKSVRFLVVRHPLLRFYSGWHQKLAKKDPTSSKILSKSKRLQNLADGNLRRAFRILFRINTQNFYDVKYFENSWNSA